MTFERQNILKLGFWCHLLLKSQKGKSKYGTPKKEQYGKMKLHRPAFMYLPACLISQTGGLSTSSPLTALSKRGSATEDALGSATVPEREIILA
jgi:hypothetical protein